MDISLNSCMIMDMRLKACSTTALGGDVCYQNMNSDSKKQLLVDVDRLSGLPDELLIRILSLLPTKDAAVASLASKRLRRSFPLTTALDIANIRISDHSECPHNLQQFPTFVTFVNTVLQSHQSEYLTSFRLGVGSDVINECPYNTCNKNCLPDVKPTSIHSWISFPLTRCCGLKELDLRIHVRGAADGRHQLPPEIFTCESLEVLKLDVNLPVHQISTFRLPMLKVLHLNNVSHVYGDGSFVAKLVSSCPVLEDLMVHAELDHVHSIVISSHSLRKMSLSIFTCGSDKTDFLRIHTPNLEYLHFYSNIALQQSITKMDHLTKADIEIGFLIAGMSCQQMLGIFRSLQNVHHLSLLDKCLQDLNVDLLKVQLPMFGNLKYLELGNNRRQCWDKVLVAFLDHSPVLETLVFPEGMIDDFVRKKNLQMEREFCRTGLATIPWCCRFHLKRIVIKGCYGNAREIDLIQFLLNHALVLEELVIFQYNGCCPRFPVVDKMELQNTIQSLPRASVTCSIQVQSTSN